MIISEMIVPNKVSRGDSTRSPSGTRSVKGCRYWSPPSWCSWIKSAIFFWL